MIPTGEQASIQAEIERLMPDTCQVITITHTSDGAGGQTDTYGTAASIACRLDYLTGTEAIAAGAIQPFGRYMLTVPAATSIVQANRILHSGITYNVLGINLDISWGMCKRAILEAIK